MLVREFSPREVADLLHCPVEQVYVRKSRAVKLLRKREIFLHLVTAIPKFAKFMD